MSSVSQEVCELWNGKSIVRSTGRPEIKQIIHLPAKEGDISPRSFITMNPETWSEGYELKARTLSAKDPGYMKPLQRFLAKLPKEALKHPSVISSSVNAGSGNEDNPHDIESRPREDTVPSTDHIEMPPNMSLNIHGGSNSIELVVSAFIATVLQVAIQVWSGFLSYSFYTLNHTNLIGSKPKAGFLLQAAGTVLLTCSLILCGGIIDSASCERHWSREVNSPMKTTSRLFSAVKYIFQALTKKQRSAADQSPRSHGNMQLYWVQKQHNAGDNSFDSYILYAEELKHEIHESHRAEERSLSYQDAELLEKKPAAPLIKFLKFPEFFSRSQRKNSTSKRHRKTTFAVVIGISGFLAQFQGLRFSNWTCSIAQLIALGVATILRAWVRRDMIRTPVNVPVNNAYILDNLALAIIGDGPNGSKFPDPVALRSPGLSLTFGVATIPGLRSRPKVESKHQEQRGYSHVSTERARNS